MIDVRKIFYVGGNLTLYSKEIFTIPNLLSCIRLSLIPVFLLVYINADYTADYYLAAFIIVLSGITDLLDGFIARHFQQITELGKVLDPIADKLTQAAIAFSLMFRFPYMWLLVILFVVKELFMGISGLLLLRKNKKLDGAKWFGKVSTAIFYVTMGILIAFPNIHYDIYLVLLNITALLLSLSFIMYKHEHKRLYQRTD